MPILKEPDAEPIPGYHLVEFLGRGGFGEVWKCEAPGGLFKAVKFVRGNMQSLDVERLQVEQEWQALQLVKTIRHPFLLAIERLEVVAGEVVIVMELADRNLADALKECRGAGLPGLPRAELLSYLREAAEALDVINLQHQLQHLDVKPANLFLVNRHVKVGDFGLLRRLCDRKDGASKELPTGLTPLYCAPEMLAGSVSGRSDQYSLAMAYQELLTGQLPFTGRNPRELIIRRASCDPDLSPLPVGDRPVVDRALARDPEARFPSCTEFVRALAPELMPRQSSPFLDVLLTERGAAEAPCNQAAATRADVTRPALLRPAALAALRVPEPPPANAPVFADHRLVLCLGRSALGEVWKVQAPDGRTRLLKFPSGLTDGSDPAEAQVLQFLSAGHPNVLPVEVLRGEGGRIGLVCDTLGGTLGDRLQHCQTLGLPGLPRRELLDHLHTAATTLDGLYRDYQVQHLCLSPRALVLDGNRLLIADIGLGQLVWLPAGHPLGQLNGRYSAPELCAGEVSPACDQYSLAVIFQELLTGTSPFRGGPGRGKARPNLDLLPAPDREPVARALNPDPVRRFVTCAEFVQALDRGAAGVPRRPTVLLPPVIPIPNAAPGPASPTPLPQSLELIGQMLEQGAGRLQVHSADGVGYLLDPGRRLRHDCAAYLPASLVPLKLESFVQQWNAEVLSADGSAFQLLVPLAHSFWQRCLGQQPALEVHLRLAWSRGTGGPLAAVSVALRPVRCEPEQAVAVLEGQGPLVLRSLRTALQVEPERRAQYRIPFKHSVGVFPVLDGQQLGDGLVCQGKDISASGLGLLAAEPPPPGHVYVQSLLTPQLAAVALLGRVLRVQPGAQGRHEVGIAFADGPEAFLATRAGVRTVRLDR